MSAPPTPPPAPPPTPPSASGDGVDADLQYNDAVELAHTVLATSRPLLIGLDIDGVLSPLVDHADDARLLSGVAAAIEGLGRLDDVIVAAVSGRALSSMQTFGLPRHVRLIGSHGMEAADTPMAPLTEAEHGRLAALTRLAQAAAESAGDGAWVESKSASVAVHVRTADPDAARSALAVLRTEADKIEGASSKPGSNVLELFARHASKGTAVAELRRATAANTTVFVGDDVTDEEAFAALGEAGITVKVGTADTIAGHRLRDPGTVLAWLRALDARLAG